MPFVVRRGREILAGVSGTAMVEAELREPEAVLDSIRATGLIDFGRPPGLQDADAPDADRSGWGYAAVARKPD